MHYGKNWIFHTLTQVFCDLSKQKHVGVKKFEKVDSDVNVPNYAGNGYNLKGYGIHDGSLRGGHYLSVATQDGKWVHIDDDDLSVRHM